MTDRLSFAIVTHGQTFRCTHTHTHTFTLAENPFTTWSNRLTGIPPYQCRVRREEKRFTPRLCSLWSVSFVLQRVGGRWSQCWWRKWTTHSDDLNGLGNSKTVLLHLSVLFHNTSVGNSQNKLIKGFKFLVEYCSPLSYERWIYFRVCAENDSWLPHKVLADWIITFFMLDLVTIF